MDSVDRLECYPATVDEKIDILDDHGRPTGRVAWKSEAHRRGLWHRCFHCWVWDVDADGPYLLAQRRAAAKDTWPGYLDVTAAGHIGAGEAVLGGGLRELEEELGLRPEPGRLVPLGTRRVELEIPAGLDREFHEVFLLRQDVPPGELRLQPEEVASVLRLRLDDAEALDQDETVPADEWSDGGHRAVGVGVADFVPAGDGYVPRVARAVRLLLDGEKPGRVF